MDIEVKLDDCQRQLVLLAIAELVLRRPGFQWALGVIADRLDGREMFQAFQEINRDLVAERLEIETQTMDPRHA